MGHIEVRDQPRFLARVHRALRHGGRFVFLSAVHPPPRSRAFWLAHGFDATMRVRNAVWTPPFVMYYLDFLVPECLERLEAAGFTVEPPLWEDQPLVRLVVADR